MYVLYSIGVMFIMLCIVDLIYFGYKKYIEIISKKSGQNREDNVPLLYPSIFLIGCLIRIIFYAKDVTFLILLKETFLWGMLALLIIFNILVIKNRVGRAKKDISIFKNIEKSDGEKLFKKKNNKK